MKRALPVLLIFLSGCIVQSFYPFYTDKSKVALPQLNGEWDAVIAFGEKQDATNVPPWQITADQILAYDPDLQTSRVHVTFFRLGGQLFCDSIAGDTTKNTPWYWTWHTRGVHTVTKVETNRDLLTFKPLDLDWITNRLASGKVSLPHLTRTEDDNWPLFTAKSSDWEKFLTKYANNADAFPTDHVYVLKRHLTVPTK
jgi:hypothetical protein